MRIVQQTPTQLKLRSPWLAPLIGWVLFSLPFLLTGLFVLLMLTTVTTLQCDRSEGTVAQCQLAMQRLWEIEATRLANGPLQGAAVATKISNRTELYQVVLQFADQTQHSFVDVWSSDPRAAKSTVEQITAFLNNPQQPTFSITQDERQRASLIGGILTGVGFLGLALPLLLVPTYSLSLNKQTSEIVSTRRTALAEKNTIWPLQQVQAAEVVEQQDSDGTAYYQAHIQLVTGETIPLLQQRGYRREVLEQLVSQIRGFLAMPT